MANTAEGQHDFSLNGMPSGDGPTGLYPGVDAHNEVTGVQPLGWSVPSDGDADDRYFRGDASTMKASPTSAYVLGKVPD